MVPAAVQGIVLFPTHVSYFVPILLSHKRNGVFKIFKTSALTSKILLLGMLGRSVNALEMRITSCVI